MLTPRAQVHEQQAYDAVYTKDGWVGAVHSKLCTSNLVSKPLWLTEVQVRNFDPTHPPAGASLGGLCGVANATSTLWHTTIDFVGCERHAIACANTVDAALQRQGLRHFTELQE